MKPSSTHLSRAAITSTAQVTGVMRGEDWLQNLQSPVQDEDMALVQRLLRISKTATAED